MRRAGMNFVPRPETKNLGGNMIAATLIALLGTSLAVVYMAVVHRWLAREAALAETPTSPATEALDC
jgi:hypothetical protein